MRFHADVKSQHFQKNGLPHIRHAARHARTFCCNTKNRFKVHRNSIFSAHCP